MKKHPSDHPELFAPTILIPAIVVPNGDGSFNVRAGKPQVVGEEISTSEFAKRTGYSHSWIMQLCQSGEIKATQRAKHGRYFIPVSELQFFKKSTTE